MANSKIRNKKIRIANRINGRTCGNCGWGQPCHRYLPQIGRVFCKNSSRMNQTWGEDNWRRSTEGGCGAWRPQKFDKSGKRIFEEFPDLPEARIKLIRERRDFRIRKWIREIRERSTGKA